MIPMLAPFLRRSLLGVAFASFAQAAWAQDAPEADDLRALRYYIQQDETAAIAAEIRRLGIEFPGWTPPEDLTILEAVAPTTEIDDIFARIARGDLTGARRVLAATRTTFPDWTPPADMIGLLETGEAQRNFDAAIAGSDPTAALRIALDAPELLRCNRVNNAWRLAELEEASGDRTAALGAYQQIVGACNSVSDVVATIEKAASVATEDQLRALVAVARRRLPASISTFDDLLTRLLAGGVGTAPSAAPATRPTATPAPATLPATPPRTLATVPSAPPPRVSPPAAAPATGAVVSTTPAVSPLASLRRTGDGRIGQVRAAARAADFRTCAARSVAPRSLDVAYERAWCVYNLDRPLEALALFTAAAGANLGGTIPRDARYGMALSLLARDMTDAASRIAAATDFDIEQRRTVEGIILDQRGVRSYQQEDFAQAIIYFNGLETLDGTLRRDLSILRAYAYLNSGDRETARREFQRLHDELATDQTRIGLAAARG